jgi:hypothetical protein
MLKLVKERVARGASAYPSWQSCLEGADRRELYPFRNPGYRRIEKEDLNASTCKLARS